MIQNLIDSALVIESLEANTKDEAFEEILAAGVAAGRIATGQLATIRKRLAEREALGSTGIGNGVAVPHVKVEAATGTVLILARSQDGIEYDAVDGRPVQAVFMVIAPKDVAAEHLVVLRWISGLARSADFRRFLRAAEDEAAIRELLREMKGG